jgi:predicted ATPase/class 3 adenylate cyclase
VPNGRSFGAHKFDSKATVHALLLTDVVDSTHIAQTLGDAKMAAVWVAHDRAARELLGPWHGREIDKSDGMLLLFDSAGDAVGYALAFHRALAERKLPIRARAGIHLGEVTIRENVSTDVARGAKPWEVSGLAVATAARIMSAAPGGRTLLSSTALSASGAEAERTKSHGHWKLKGIAEPVELFEVIDSGGSFQSPRDAAKAYRVVRRGDSWMPVREIANSVPAERDDFIGRRAAMHELARRVDDGARLISVLGVGGTGKTRLVTRFARDWLGEFPGGAWFCDLSAARELEGIHVAVAQGLGLQLGRTEPVAQITNAIAGRAACLVILDNFEQVARYAEQTLGTWLNGAPQATFLVTTREVLGIAGETVFALPPLQSDDAVDLFLRRAKAAHQGFAPSATERSAVDQLAKTLDGLPLAIELAAARVRVMSPVLLLQRMSRRFDLLSSHGGRPDRQATLRATFDWSWDLLDVAERSVLSQLVVFQGSFGIEAVEAVVELPGATSGVDLLGSLVDKSLVRQLDGYRFSLLESVRDYATLHLRTDDAQAGEAVRLVELRSRHWRYFAHMSQHAAVAQRCADLDNLIVACRAACGAGDAPSASRCLVNAWAALRFTGPYRAAVELAKRVAAMTGLSTSEAGLVHWVLGTALDLLGEVDAAREHLQVGLDRTASAAPSEASARLLLALGTQLTLEGHLAHATDHLENALRQAVELQHTWLQANALNALGRLMDHQAQGVEARQLYLQALDLARAMGDRQMEGGLLGNLGGLHHDVGELDAARHHYEMALEVAEDMGDSRWLGNACSNLGLLLLEQGHHAQARDRLNQARELARSTGNARLEYTVACNLGILLAAQGRLTEAEQHLTEAVDAAVRAADRRSEGQFRGYLALTLARQGRLNEGRTALELGEQALSSLSDRLSLALLRCDRAEVEWLGGRAEAAQHAHETAQGVADELACGADSELRRRIQTVAALLAG